MFMHRVLARMSGQTLGEQCPVLHLAPMHKLLSCTPPRCDKQIPV